MAGVITVVTLFEHPCVSNRWQAECFSTKIWISTRFAEQMAEETIEMLVIGDATTQQKLFQKLIRNWNICFENVSNHLYYKSINKPTNICQQWNDIVRFLEPSPQSWFFTFNVHKIEIIVTGQIQFSNMKLLCYFIICNDICYWTRS